MTIFLVLVAAIAVAVALVFGLKNMMLGGSAQMSQKLMRLRVTSGAGEVTRPPRYSTTEQP